MRRSVRRSVAEPMNRTTSSRPSARCGGCKSVPGWSAHSLPMRTCVISPHNRIGRSTYASLSKCATGARLLRELLKFRLGDAQALQSEAQDSAWYLSGQTVRCAGAIAPKRVRVFDKRHVSAHDQAVDYRVDRLAGCIYRHIPEGATLTCRYLSCLVLRTLLPRSARLRRSVGMAVGHDGCADALACSVGRRRIPGLP